MGYIDDLCVVTFGSVEVHEVLLRRILAAMEKCRLRLQPAKCEIFRTHGHFLGHVISSGGISQQADKLQGQAKREAHAKWREAEVAQLTKDLENIVSKVIFSCQQHMPHKLHQRHLYQTPPHKCPPNCLHNQSYWPHMQYTC